MDFLDWCDNADYGSLVDDFRFRELLELTTRLCDRAVLREDAPSTRYRYWFRQSEEQYGDSVANFIATVPLDYFLPFITEEVDGVLEQVGASYEYWQAIDPMLADLSRKLTRKKVKDTQGLYEWFKENGRHLRNEYL